MVASQRRLVWVVVACVAVAAQAAPRVACQACDQCRCSGSASGGPAGAEPGGESVGTCPLCAAAGHRDTTEPTQPPCRCQWTARNGQPLSLSKGSAPPISDADAAVALAGLPRLAPRALGVSREYVASSLAVPIRPPRILFGVWRN